MTDGERVYAISATSACSPRPRRRGEFGSGIEPHKTRFGWGTAASPVLHGDRIYLVNDNEEDSYLLALEPRPATKSGGSLATRRATGPRRTFGRKPAHRNRHTRHRAVRSYDLDGKLLWSLQGMSSITIATPCEDDGLLFVSSGYVKDKLRPLYAIRPEPTATSR